MIWSLIGTEFSKKFLLRFVIWGYADCIMENIRGSENGSECVDLAIVRIQAKDGGTLD